MKTAKIELLLEALDILEKGSALSEELQKKRKNGEEISIAAMKELLMLTRRRDEIIDILEKEEKHEEIRSDQKGNQA